MAHPPSGYISLTNFEKYQQYRDGRPLHWIKLYLSLLDDYTFCALPDAVKWQLIGLMLLAGKYDNRIPADKGFLATKLSCKSVDLDLLLGRGFIAYETVRNRTELSDDPLLRVEKSREEESREEKTIVPCLAFGEFQRVHLTEEQHGKLLARLNGNLEAYIANFDRWVNEAPEAKTSGVRRRDRHAYESILAWFDRDVKGGKVKPGAVTPMAVPVITSDHWTVAGVWQPTEHAAACGHVYECDDDLCQDGATVGHYCPSCVGAYQR